MGIREVGRFWRAVFREATSLPLTSMAASLAFFTLFALPPILVGVLLVAGEVLGNAEAEAELLSWVNTQFGSDTRTTVAGIVQNLPRVGVGELPTQLFTGVVLLFAATAAFGQLQTVLNIIWQAKPRRRGIQMALKTVKRLVTFLLVIIISLVVLGGATILVALHVSPDEVATTFAEWLPDAWGPYAATILDQVGFLVIAFVGLALIFHLLPDARVPAGAALRGAALTAVLWLLAKHVLVQYLRHSWRNETFGAAGSIVAMLVAFYAGAFLLLLGAVVSHAYATQRSEA